MSEDFKKVTNATELIDEELLDVAGGYNTDYWNSLSTEERIEKFNLSMSKKQLGEYCAMQDPNAVKDTLD